jgi:hypothetical protein
VIPSDGVFPEPLPLKNRMLLAADCGWNQNLFWAVCVNLNACEFIGISASRKFQFPGDFTLRLDGWRCAKKPGGKGMYRGAKACWVCEKNWNWIKYTAWTPKLIYDPEGNEKIAGFGTGIFSAYCSRWEPLKGHVFTLTTWKVNKVIPKVSLGCSQPEYCR